jgi:hypothetical protein
VSEFKCPYHVSEFIPSETVASAQPIEEVKFDPSKTQSPINPIEEVRFILSE